MPAPEVTGTREDPDETTSVAPTAGQDQADLRPWRERDLSPRVMWKRYARTGQLVVADWEAQGGSPNWLDFSAFPGVDTELRLSYLAWMVHDRTAKGTKFGLNLPGEIIEPDTGSHHAQRCLRALAVWGREKPRDSEALSHGTRSEIDRPASGSLS